MTAENPDVTPLVQTLRRHFERDATRDEVRSAVKDACVAMYAAGVAPQTMLVALKAAVHAAALEARTIVHRDDLRSVTSDLTPWMIDVCFSPAKSLRD
jgi:MoxR-like ATPase